MNKKALVVVDYQNSFADETLGELYVPGGEKIASLINILMEDVKSKGGLIIASRDMHRAGNISFASNFAGKTPFTSLCVEDIKDWTDEKNGILPSAGFSLSQLKNYLAHQGGTAMLWPSHCVVNTLGCDYYSDFDTHQIDIEVAKGYAYEQHPYSAVGGIELGTTRTLSQILQDEDIQEIDVVGLASDYCVKDTALELAEQKKWQINLILKATACVSPDTQVDAIAKMKAQGITIIE